MAPQDRQYKKFDPTDYQKIRAKSEEGPKREVEIPKGIDDILGDIHKTVSQSNLSEQYRQQGGQ